MTAHRLWVSKRTMMTILLLAVVVACAAAAVSAQSADSWPQFRGPGRNATVPATQLPSAWPSTFQRAWRVTVGEGYSSPVLGAGRAFVHSRKDPQEVVT